MLRFKPEVRIGFFTPQLFAMLEAAARWSAHAGIDVEINSVNDGPSVHKPNSLAARIGELPQLLELADMLAELHVHSDWSDGRLSILEMAHAARQRGKRALAITDHSVGLGVAGGLSVDEIKHHRAEIGAAQSSLGDSLTILQGAEVGIRSDGSLDYPDEVLAELDIVIASLQSGLRQPREKGTERTLSAIRNPHVDVIAHPTGRMIPDREGADLDMEAVFQSAKETGVALEVNAHPSRLDLDDTYARH